MRRLKAEEKLEDPYYLDRLTIDGYYNLLIDAGFSEDEAQDETNRRSWDRLASGQEI